MRASMIGRENMNMSKFFYAEIWPNPDIDFDKKEYTQSKIILLNEKKKT